MLVCLSAAALLFQSVPKAATIDQWPYSEHIVMDNTYPCTIHFRPARVAIGLMESMAVTAKMNLLIGFGWFLPGRGCSVWLMV